FGTSPASYGTLPSFGCLADRAGIESVSTTRVFKRLKEQISIPLAAGERDRTIWEFIPYLQNRCLDILQPDCCHTGGITSMKKIATLAEAYHTPLAPHCTAGFLGIAASLHVVASIPLFLIHEF